MTTLAWRVAPVLTLTVRQFLGGKAVRVVIGLSCIPIVFALIYLINTSVERPRIFIGKAIFAETMIPTVLPLAILVLATGAFGDEIEDRTLPYLTLKPISRFRLVFEKFLGSVLISAPIVIGGMLISFLLVFRGDSGDNVRLFAAIAVACAMATIVYSSIFLLISLLISRALIAALVYSLVWETILARFVPGLRYVSIRHFVRSVFAAIAEDRRFDFTNSAGLTAALLTLIAATAIAILLSTWRLGRMNLE